MGRRRLNFKADRIARQLERFLEKGDENRFDRASPRSLRLSDDALSPAVAFALHRLRRTAPLAAKLVSASAWRDLGNHLNARLMFALGPTLRVEQIAAQAVTRSFGNSSRLLKVTLSEIMRTFPGALETAAQLIADWIDAQRELLNRISRDREVLRINFLGRKNRSCITTICPGLSDPHDGGRTVTLVEFADNRPVVYKPRASDAEEFWFGALSWLNRNGLHEVFRVPLIISRQNYSWMEFIEPRSCRNLNAVRLFYFRWGAQAALAQVLAVSDLHRENWLASGSQPVLLDAELIGGEEGISQRDRKKRLDRQSLPALLETGLLPFTSRDGVGRYEAIAPFDALLAKDSPLICWPRHQGILQPPWKYVNNLVSGFEAAAKIFTEQDLARQFFDEVIRCAKVKSPQRILFRASAEYLQLLRKSLQPPNMLSREKRWRWLAQNCRASSINGAIGLTEARALARCDLPRFSMRRTAPPISWRRLLAQRAQLRGASLLLRRRVQPGASGRGIEKRFRLSKPENHHNV